MSHFFNRFSAKVSEATGSYLAFVVAAAVVLAWAITGPFFHFSENWQLAINTGTTIITFLMVFLIQNAQNRDGMATQLKLDEIIHAITQADDDLIDSENATDKELRELQKRYALLAHQHRELKSKLDELGSSGD